MHYSVGGSLHRSLAIFLCPTITFSVRVINCSMWFHNTILCVPRTLLYLCYSIRVLYLTYYSIHAIASMYCTAHYSIHAVASVYCTLHTTLSML